MLVIIDNYDSFTFNLVQFFGDLGVSSRVVRNDAASVAEVMAMGASALVLSPGPCTPDEAGICLDLVAAAGAARVPLLGVCLGHQAIGQAFGARVIRAPEPVHGKVWPILHGGPHTDSALHETVFSGLPSPTLATRYHSLIVARDSLPDALAITAETSDGLIMGLQHRTLPIHGVQFHPESIATAAGRPLLSRFLDLAGVDHTPFTLESVA